MCGSGLFCACILFAAFIVQIWHYLCYFNLSNCLSTLDDYTLFMCSAIQECRQALQLTNWHGAKRLTWPLYHYCMTYVSVYIF